MRIYLPYFLWVSPLGEAISFHRGLEVAIFFLHRGSKCLNTAELLPTYNGIFYSNLKLKICRRRVNPTKNIPPRERIRHPSMMQYLTVA